MENTAGKEGKKGKSMMIKKKETGEPRGKKEEQGNTKEKGEQGHV